MAERLRASTHDVQSVLERPDLIGRSDEVVFELAQSEGRAVLTENVPDYRRLAAEALGAGEVHHGLVFTSNRSWPRHHRSTFSRLVTELGRFLVGHEAADALRGREWWPRPP